MQYIKVSHVEMVELIFAELVPVKLGDILPPPPPQSNFGLMLGNPPPPPPPPITWVTWALYYIPYLGAYTLFVSTPVLISGISANQLLFLQAILQYKFTTSSIIYTLFVDIFQVCSTIVGWLVQHKVLLGVGVSPT